MNPVVRATASLISQELCTIIQTENLREKFADTQKKAAELAGRSIRPQEVYMKGFSFLAEQRSIRQLFQRYNCTQADSRTVIAQVMANEGLLKPFFSEPDPQVEVQQPPSNRFQIEKGGALAFIWNEILKPLGQALFLTLGLASIVAIPFIAYFANRKVEQIQNDLPPGIAPVIPRPLAAVSNNEPPGPLLYSYFAEEDHPFFDAAPPSPKSSTENSSSESSEPVSSSPRSSSLDSPKEAALNAPSPLGRKASFHPDDLLIDELEEVFTAYIKDCKKLKNIGRQVRSKMNGVLNRQVSEILKKHNKAGHFAGTGHVIFQAIMKEALKGELSPYLKNYAQAKKNCERAEENLRAQGLDLGLDLDREGAVEIWMRPEVQNILRAYGYTEAQFEAVILDHLDTL